MRISTIIPVYNYERFIGQAIESVLRQSRKIDEVIVVNDGSTDGTSKILDDMKSAIRVLDVPHAGMASALNAGLAVSTGDILTFLDADDIWTQDKTAIQLAYLADHPVVDAVFGMARQFSSNQVIPEPEILRIAQPPQRGISKVAMMIRRTSFDCVGAFDSEMKASDFVEWYTRAAASSLRMDMLDQVVAYRRLHDNNTGRTMRELQTKENLDALRGMLARKRK